MLIGIIQFDGKTLGSNLKLHKIILVEVTTEVSRIIFVSMDFVLHSFILLNTNIQK